MSKSGSYWVEKLSLKPHPEGGYYRQIFQSNTMVVRDGVSKPAATSIYYLLEGSDQSHFHRLASDEIWYYHDGSNAIVHMIEPDRATYQGIEISEENPQVVIPAGTVFGAELVDKDQFILVGCMVAPGFSFEDFELISKSDLMKSYPQHARIIDKIALS